MQENQSDSNKFQVVLLITPLLGLSLISFQNYLLFHSIAEVYSIVIACGIFMLAWNSRKILQNHYLLFLGIAYLFIASIDLVHALAYKGMEIFQGNETNPTVQLWIIARYMESISLLIAPVFFKRKLNPYLASFTYLLITLFFLTTVFYWKIFPECFIEGKGLTPFKIYSEYLICIILLSSIYILFQGRNDLERNIFGLMIASIVMTIGAELLFTFYVNLYGLSNLAGHLFKIVSFYLIYKAIIETGLVKPYALLFRDLKQRESSLKTANEQLQLEITERKQAEDALGESEKKFRNIIESLPLGVHMYQRAENSTMRFIGSNPAADEILGVDNSQYIGKTLDEVFPDMLDTEVPKHFLDIAENGGFWHKEDLSYNGAQISRAFENYNFQTSPGSMVSLFADITERKQMEEKLRLTKDRADAANLAKSQFLANMSHEIRTPLNSIIGFSQVLLRRSETMILPQEFLQFLQNISISGQTLTTLINDILEISKIEAGKIKIIEKDFDLRQFITEIVTVYEAQAIQKKVVFNYDIDAELPVLIHSDKAKLTQVLINLIGNALKFTPENKEVKLKISGNNKTLAIVVSDQGIGIPEENLESIFDPFEQTALSVSQHFEGTGLGLAITKRLIGFLGGEISVQSQVSQGSSFEVTLPLKEAVSPVLKYEKTKSNVLECSNECVILMIEDNIMNQKLIEVLLKEIGLEIYFADDGKSGVQKTLDLKPDLILMDIQMPGISGIEATKRIRKIQEFQKIPIIGLSAEAFTDQQQDALDAGMNDYLLKPVNFEQLVEVFNRHLSTPSL